MATHYRFIVYSFNFHNQCTLLISLNIKTFDSWQMFLFQSDRPTGALSFVFILSILLNRFLSIDAQHTLSLSLISFLWLILPGMSLKIHRRQKKIEGFYDICGFSSLHSYRFFRIKYFLQNPQKNVPSREKNV